MEITPPKITTMMAPIAIAKAFPSSGIVIDIKYRKKPKETTNPAITTQTSRKQS